MKWSKKGGVIQKTLKGSGTEWNKRDTHEIKQDEG
jgi:hypothetical protein